MIPASVACAPRQLDAARSPDPAARSSRLTPSVPRPDCWLIGGLTTEQAAVYYQHLVRSAKGSRQGCNVLSAQGNLPGLRGQTDQPRCAERPRRCQAADPADLFRDAARSLSTCPARPVQGASPGPGGKKNGLTPGQYTVSQTLAFEVARRHQRGDHGQRPEQAGRAGGPSLRLFPKWLASQRRAGPSTWARLYRARLYGQPVLLVLNDSSCWAVTQYSLPTETFYEFTVRATDEFERRSPRRSNQTCASG